MSGEDWVAIRTLFGEARGEPIEGQRAVAHVLRNRLAAGKFGQSIAEVCMTRLQFSCWLQSQDNLPNWHQMVRRPDNDPLILQLAAVWQASATEPDPTNGATHYYAMSMPKAPIWTLGATLCGQFGHQKFFKGIV